MAALRFCAAFASFCGPLRSWLRPRMLPSRAPTPTAMHFRLEALARFGTAQLRLPPLFYSLALSSDGKLLAAGNGDGVVILIDAVTGLEVRRMKVGSPGPVSIDHATHLDERQTSYVLPGSHGDLFFSPDNSRLVTVSQKDPKSTTSKPANASPLLTPSRPRGCRSRTCLPTANGLLSPA